MTATTNQKYEITDIAHEQYPFLHRIRALRDIGVEVKAGDLGGFVESESNLSFEPGDDAWIFDNAIACMNAYVSHEARLSGHARAEDDSYIRGAVLCAFSRISGTSMILASPDTHSIPILSGHCAVYGKVSGNVRLTGEALVISSEDIHNDSLDILSINECGRMMSRDPLRDKLKPTPARRVNEKRSSKKREVTL